MGAGTCTVVGCHQIPNGDCGRSDCPQRGLEEGDAVGRPIEEPVDESNPPDLQMFKKGSCRLFVADAPTGPWRRIA